LGKFRHGIAPLLLLGFEICLVSLALLCILPATFGQCPLVARIAMPKVPFRFRLGL
jgi:hypothetical protein